MVTGNQANYYIFKAETYGLRKHLWFVYQTVFKSHILKSIHLKLLLLFLR